jgi:YD repeat-containing protein
MVGIVSGNGLGLFNTSQDLLGLAIGQTNLGQAGGKAYVNAATGNLSVQFLDESLSGSGTDILALRTYNSSGALNDGDADGWRWQGERKVVLTGTANTTGAAVTRTLGDGSEAIFKWDGVANSNRYVSTAGSGAHDVITWNAAGTEWVFNEDAKGDFIERYDGTTGWIKISRDPGANGFDYTFVGNKIATIKDILSGQTLEFVYGTNGKLERLDTRTTSGGALSRQVYYSYDASLRLSSVKTDLTPTDSLVTDNNVYTTTYTYDGTSTRIASISQSDGTSILFTYDVNGKIASVTDQFWTTNFVYNTTTNKTTVTNGLNQSWVYSYDTAANKNRLLKMESPTVNGVIQSSTYTYDAEGNVKTITDGRNNVITYTYDANGNRTKEVDSLGNTLARTFSANNLLLTETRYTVPSLTAPSGAETTRYVYDFSMNRLRFVVSAEGRVEERRYHLNNQVFQTVQYAGGLYTGAGAGEVDLNAWVATQDKTKTQLSEFAYDYRGNLAKTTSYATVNSAGAGVLDNATNITEYVYSEYGQLVQTVVVRGTSRTTKTELSSYIYDGMGRQTSMINSGVTTTTAYSGVNITVATAATGLSVISTTDNRGRLISLTQNGDNGSGSTTNRITKYYYDAAGQVVMTESPTGARSYSFYDAAGRVNAKVDATGATTAYTYDADGRVLTETQYANSATATGWFSGTGVTKPSLTFGATATDIITDAANDRKTTYTYDAAGRLLTTTVDGIANAITNTYDGESRLVKTTQGDRITNYYYDKDGRQVGMLNADRYLTQYVYDSVGRLASTVRYGSIQLSVAQQATFTFDALRLIADDGPWQITHYFYDSEGRQVGVVNEQGFLTETVYDAANNLRQTIQYLTPVVVSTSPTFFILETLAAVKTRAGASETTTMNFDIYGRVDKVTTHDGTISRNIYDTAGRLIRQIQAEGTSDQRASRTRYNAFGEVTGIIGGVGDATLSAAPSDTEITTAITNYGTTVQFDGAGRKIAELGPVEAGKPQAKTFLYYNAAGQLIYTINNLGEVSKTSYNSFGEVTGVRVYTGRISLTGITGGLVTAGLDTTINAINSTTDKVISTQYNKFGQVATYTDAEGFVTTNNYTAFGQANDSLQAIASGVTTKTLNTYDKLGRVLDTTRDQLGLAAKTSVIYDGFGRIKSTTDANRNSTATQYLDNGKTIVITDALGGNNRTEIDALGRTLKSVDALGNVTLYTYDDASRKTTVTHADGTSISTIKTRTGETLSTQDANGNITTYTYTKDGILDTVVGPPSQVSGSYGVTVIDKDYDRSGRLAQSKDANGVITSYSYDAANRIISKVVDSVSGGLNLTTTYQFDGQGRQLQVTEAVGKPEALVTKYVYDRKDQIKQIIVDPNNRLDANGNAITVTAGLDLTTTFTYDGVGETLTVEKGTVANPSQQKTAYTFDKLGRKTSEIVNPGGLNITTQYQYDSNGNLVKKMDANNNATYFAYDAVNRLRFTVNAEGAVSENVYDANGNVISTTQYEKKINTSIVMNESDIKFQLGYWIQDFSVNANGLSLPATNFAVTSGKLVMSSIKTAAGTASSFPQAWGTARALGTAFRYEFSTDGSTNSHYATIGINSTDWKRRHAVNQSGGTFYAEYVDATGAVKSQALGTIKENTQYVLEIETDLNGSTLYLYEAGQPRSTAFVDRRAYSDWKDAATWLLTGNVAGFNASSTTYLDAVQESLPSSGRTTNFVYDTKNRLRFTIDATGAVSENIYDANGNVLRTVNYANKLSESDIASLTTLKTVGTNRVNNSTFSNPINGVPEGWSVGAYRAAASGYGVNYNPDWTLQGQPAGDNTLWLSQVGRDPVDAYQEFSQVVNSVTPGKRYIFSVYTGAHRASVLAQLSWVDANGNFIGEATAGRNDAEQVGGQSLASYKRIAANGIAPEGAVKAVMFIRKYNTLAGQADSYMFAAHAQFEEVPATATQPADWVKVLIKPNTTSDRATNFVYDKANRQTKTTLAGWYDISDGRVYANQEGQTDRFQRTVEVTYDNAGRAVLNKIRIATGGTAATDFIYQYKTYDAAGREINDVDALRYVTQKTYDDLGNVKTVTRGASAIAAVNARGYWLNSEIAIQTGRTTSYGYDSVSRLTSVTEPNTVLATNYVSGNSSVLVNTLTPTYTSGAAVNTYQYDDVGNLVKQTRTIDASSLAENYFYYDKVGRQTLSVNALGYGTKTDYDALSNVVSTTEYANVGAGTLGSTTVAPTYTVNGKDRITINTFDKLGRAVTVSRKFDAATYGVGAAQVVTNTISYNAFGQINSSKDAANNETTFEYNKLGQTTKMTEPSRVVAGTGVDVFRNQLSAAPITSLVYNSFGENTSTTQSVSAGLGVTKNITHVYDFAGNEIQTTDTLGNTFNKQYDALGRVTKQTQNVSVTNASADTNYSYTIERRFEFDALGRQTAALDVFNGNTQISGQVNQYNGYGEITNEYKVWGAVGTSTSVLMSTPTANAIVNSYTYDNAGRVATLRNTDGLTNFYYNFLGNVTRVEQQATVVAPGDNNRITENYYDKLGRVVVQRLPKKSNLTVTGTNTYTSDYNTPLLQTTLDRWGNALVRKDALNVATTYVYNQDNQMTNEFGALADNVINYDGTSTAAVSLEHRLAYDTLGRLVQDSYIPTGNAAHTTTNLYNAVGQLIKTTDAMNVSQEFIHDAFGNRIGSKDGIGHIMVDTFDANNKLVNHSLLRYGATLEYTGDPTKNPTSITLATYQYDQAGRQYGVADAAGNFQYYRYDERSNITVDRSRTGGLKTYTYDELGHKTSENSVIVANYYNYLSGPGGAATLTNSSTTTEINNWNYKNASNDFVDYGVTRIQARVTGGLTYSYAYNGFGQMVAEAQVNDPNKWVKYYYHENGLLASVYEDSYNPFYGTTILNVSHYGYDIKGNRTRAYDESTFSATGEYVHGIVETLSQYDALNRLVKVNSPSTTVNIEVVANTYGTTNLTSLSFNYDQYGNKRKVSSTYTLPGGTSTTRDEWYSYDNANRVIVEGGVSYGGTAVLFSGAGQAQGVAYQYDSAGRRVTEESWKKTTQPYGGSAGFQTYAINYYNYNDLGLVSNISRRENTRALTASSNAAYVTIGALSSVEANTYDNRGFRLSSLQQANDRGITSTYDASGNLTNQTTTVLSTGRKDTIRDNYGYDNLGNLFGYRDTFYDKTTTANAQTAVNVYNYTYANTYTGRQISSVAVSSTQAGTVAGITTNKFDSRGRIIVTSITEANSANTSTGTGYRKFLYNTDGEVIIKAEKKFGDSSYKIQNYYYSNEGELANLGTIDGVDISPLSAIYEGGDTPSSYIIKLGDSLMSIAQSIFGDANLWYIIADANGLSQGPTDRFTASDAGRSLRIPNKDYVIGNSSRNFKSYNANSKIGSLTPSLARAALASIGTTAAVKVAFDSTMITGVGKLTPAAFWDLGPSIEDNIKNMSFDFSGIALFSDAPLDLGFGPFVDINNMDWLGAGGYKPTAKQIAVNEARAAAEAAAELVHQAYVRDHTYTPEHPFVRLPGPPGLPMLGPNNGEADALLLNSGLFISPPPGYGLYDPLLRRDVAIAYYGRKDPTPPGKHATAWEIADYKGWLLSYGVYPLSDYDLEPNRLQLGIGQSYLDSSDGQKQRYKDAQAYVFSGGTLDALNKKHQPKEPSLLVQIRDEVVDGFLSAGVGVSTNGKGVSASVGGSEVYNSNNGNINFTYNPKGNLTPVDFSGVQPVGSNGLTDNLANLGNYSIDQKFFNELVAKNEVSIATEAHQTNNANLARSMEQITLPVLNFAQDNSFQLFSNQSAGFNSIINSSQMSAQSLFSLDVSNGQQCLVPGTQGWFGYASEGQKNIYLNSVPGAKVGLPNFAYEAQMAQDRVNLGHSLLGPAFGAGTSVAKLFGADSNTQSMFNDLGAIGFDVAGAIAAVPERASSPISFGSKYGNIDVPSTNRINVSTNSVAINRQSVQAYGVSTTLSAAQARHTPPVTDGRSVLTANPSFLLDGLHGGQYTVLRQTRQGSISVDFGRPIGDFWNLNGYVGQTNFGTVSWGKKGSHIIPANPIQVKRYE